ncbi:hypothetical protein D1J36_007430 [Riemerella anatipestifer]|uniref:hypothetical protein n=1 Tax=Riemerella anatipestifer TaxID=34085 RepID=UPI0012AD600B|nr:hypothetical protein [Riemerella anatipestifer]MDY3339116.1 hypothetical protein [Riemerella anatipestifer]MDY3520977.1 hypothetical protein [Riemerella anatipestifer]MDY3533262.1 hypothetical protein [Riemerella anatipestifer]MDY3535272.1 hypothetical protein [Riemerella anatipestifer]USL95111.1 hypothetical protein D1J36_007430 [Riemerella anatipestifer]
MSNLDQIEFFKIFTLLSPFIAAFIAARLTFFFTLKSKKFDILYANKIPAFKNINEKLIEYKIFCLGRVAYFEGNELSPYWYEDIGAFEFRKSITKVYEENSIFVSKKSRISIEKLINNLSLLCNMEIQIVDDKLDERIDLKEIYFKSYLEVDKLIQILYEELNLK